MAFAGIFPRVVDEKLIKKYGTVSQVPRAIPLPPPLPPAKVAVPAAD